VTSLFANAVAMLAARLAPPAFSFAINVAIARLHGTDSLGVYVYLLSLLVIFQAVASAGMTQLLVRELAAHPTQVDRLVRQGRTLGIATGSLATAGFLLYARFVADGTSSRAADALSLYLLPSAWIAVQEAFFIARCEHHAVTVVAVVENAIKLLLAIAVFWFGGGLVELCLAISASRVCALVFGQILMHRAGSRAGFRPELHGLAPLARALPSFGGMFVLAMVFFRVDVLVLGAMRGERETGIYGAGLTLYSVALLLPDSVLAAVYPRLAASFRSGRDGFARAALLAAKLLAIGLVPVSVGLIDLAPAVLGHVYGEKFLEAAPALALLGASLPIHALNGAFGQALQAGGYQGAMLCAGLVGTAIHVAITLALVALLGVPGAPLALLISSSLLALMSGYLFHTRVRAIEIRPRTVWTASAVAGPIALALLVPQPYAVAGAIAGGLWIALAFLAEQVLARTELDEVVRALGARRAEASA
jgi:O-antigen/teichoic acid export membrane protein